MTFRIRASFSGTERGTETAGVIPEPPESPGEPFPCSGEAPKPIRQYATSKITLIRRARVLICYQHRLLGRDLRPRKRDADKRWDDFFKRMSGFRRGHGTSRTRWRNCPGCRANGRAPY